MKPTMSPFSGHLISLVLFSHFWNLFVQEKKAVKEEKLKQEEKYMWAILDGVKEKVIFIYLACFLEESSIEDILYLLWQPSLLTIVQCSQC